MHTSHLLLLVLLTGKKPGCSRQAGGVYLGLLDALKQRSTAFIGREANKAWLTGSNRKINGKKEVTALFFEILCAHF